METIGSGALEIKHKGERVFPRLGRPGTRRSARSAQRRLDRIQGLPGTSQLVASYRLPDRLVSRVRYLALNAA